MSGLVEQFERAVIEGQSKFANEANRHFINKCRQELLDHIAELEAEVARLWASLEASEMERERLLTWAEECASRRVNAESARYEAVQRSDAISARAEAAERRVAELEAEVKGWMNAAHLSACDADAGVSADEKLRARNAELEAEVAWLKEAVEAHERIVRKSNHRDTLRVVQIKNLIQKNATAERRAERLAGALRPFAKMADEIERCASQYTGPESDPNNWAKSCAWEDLVEARAALADEPGEKGDDNDAA